MKKMILMVGAPGSGKSTWIKENGFENHTVSSDQIRLLVNSPSLNNEGEFVIPQFNNKIVWDMLYYVIEERMKNGDFIVVDATHSTAKSINSYKKLKNKYNYQVFCVDFSKISLDELISRNEKRDQLKKVPKHVIESMHENLKGLKFPSWVKVISPKEINSIFWEPMDLSSYKKIHVIGDIHGCYSVLKEYIGEIKEEDFYIFTGDYLDRGRENQKVLNFLLEIMELPNVIFLEGNHERWLRDWSVDIPAKSKEFENYTRIQLEWAGINKKDVKAFCKKLIDCAYITYDDKIYFICHGGIPNLPKNIFTISSQQLIRGVGLYSDCKVIGESWIKNMPEQYYQIHGHRNVENLDIQENSRVFNLEGGVEKNGYLRVVELVKGSVNKIELKNHYEIPESIEELILKFRLNEYIKENKFDQFSSFNFTKEAFYEKIWDEQTIKARGLFIDVIKNKVAARGYEKFFYINERKETSMDYLKEYLNFPVTAYVKENGYLGIISYNEYTDDLLIATKSSINSEYSKWLRDLLYNQLNSSEIDRFKTFIKEHDVSFVFESIDQENDPHLIDYENSQLVLLDIIYNKIDFKKFQYEDLCKVAKDFGFKCKERAIILKDWNELEYWAEKIKEKGYKYNNNYIEGFVLEDANGYMLKIKCFYYLLWKTLRSLVKTLLEHPEKELFISESIKVYEREINDFYFWFKDRLQKEKIPTNIRIKDIRKEYLSRK